MIVDNIFIKKESMQNNHQKNNHKFDRSNSKGKSLSANQTNGHSKSLLERLANAPTSNDK